MCILTKTFFLSIKSKIRFIGEFRRYRAIMAIRCEPASRRRFPPLMSAAGCDTLPLMFSVRRRTGLSRFVGLVVATSLALLAVLQGDVFCFCTPRDGDSAHVCPSEVDFAAMPSADGAGAALWSTDGADWRSLVSAPCDHVRVSSPDWFPPHEAPAVSQSFAFPVPSWPGAAVATAARAFKDVPRATSPPDIGTFLLAFNVRVHARS